MRRLCTASILVALTGCGGGGGSGASGTSNLPPAVANANSDQQAFTFVDFSYDASQAGATFADADGDMLTYTVAMEPDDVGLSSDGPIISGQLTKAGDVEVTITAADSEGARAADVFVISGRESVSAASHCPAPDSELVAVNSAVSVSVDAALDPVTVATDALQVTCGGVAIDGETSPDAGATKLLFVADGLLPENARCRAEAGTGILSVDGRPLGPATWAFSTGDSTKFEWKPGMTTDLLTVGRDPVFGLPQFGMHYSFFANGRHVVFFSLGGNFHTAVSSDNGASYEVSDPILDEIWITQPKADLSFAVADGTFHVVFRTQGFSSVTGLETIEVIYLHSTGSFLEFSEPAIVSEEHDEYSVFNPGIAVGNGRIYFSWEQRPCFGCSQLLPDQGIYMAEVDGTSGALLGFDRLAIDAKLPYMEIADGVVVLQWILVDDLPGQRKEFYNYTDSLPFTIDDDDGVRGRMHLQTTDRTKVMYTWMTGDGDTGDRWLNHALYDTALDTITYHIRARTLTPAGGLVCPGRISSDRAGNVARSVIAGDLVELRSGQTGTIDFSEDGGNTFAPLMDATVYDNNWCPLPAVKGQGTVFIAAVDSQGSSDPEQLVLNATRMQKSAPCH